MRALFFVFVITSMFVSCSQKSANTSIKVSTSALFGGSAALQQISEGGLMVWGVSNNGHRFGQTIEDTDTINLDLPNGTWTFYAVAWDNATNEPLLASTDLRCAESTPTQLAGTAVNVALAVSPGACANTMFRGYATSANSGTIKARLCEDVSSITSHNDVCTDDRTNASRKSDKVPMLSVKVTLPNYINNADVPGGISRCMVMPANPSGAWTDASSLRLPIGDIANPTKSPFRLRLEFFPGNTTCDNSGTIRGSVTRILPNGLLTPIPTIKTHQYAGEHYTFLAITDAEICNGRTGTYNDGTGARFFAGGDGTQNWPHLICSAAQLYDIHELTSFGDSYKLLTDIDLNAYSVGLGNTAPLPSDSDCWETGQNWQPIGHRLAPPGSSCVETVTAHNGSFDGNGHIISGMRQRFNNNDYIGFIGRWESTTGYIRDLIFQDPEVAGRMKVGTLIGGREGGGARGLVDNIQVKRARVEASNDSGMSYVGGLVGYADEIDITNIQVNGRVDGEGQYIGGVFGYVDNPFWLRYIFSRTHVKHRKGSGPPVAKIGGVGGYMAGMNLDSGGFKVISHEGSIISEGKEVGGLFGHLGALNGPLNHYYALTAISTIKAQSNKVGGIVGFMEHDGAINTGYFGGQINDACTASCDRGYLYGYDDDIVDPTVSGAYYVSDDAPTQAGKGDNIDATAVVVTPRPNDNSGTSLTSNTWTSSVFTDTPNPWVHVNGDHPRFIAEKHPCSANAVNGVSNRDSLTTQNASRGTSLNPIMICRRDQFSSLGSITDTNVVVIPTAVNLAGASFPGPTIDADVTVDGWGQGMLFGLNRSTATNANWAIFGPIYGKLKNLLIRATNLSITSGATSSDLSTIAQYNYGEISNIDISGVRLSTNDPDVYISGVVYSNQGNIKSTSFDGHLKGQAYIAGFAYFNSSGKTIQDSRAYGSIDVTAAGSYFSGFVADNSGTLARNEVSSRLNSTSTLNHVSQFVGINKGSVTDAHITDMANWEFPFGTDIAQLTYANTGSPENGSITRALVEGTFLNTNISSSSIPGSPEDQAPAVVTVNSAPHQGVFAVPAGRKIFYTNNAATCGANTTYNILNTSLSSAFDWASGYFEPAMNAAGKVVWLKLESNGKTGYLNVINGTNNGTTLTLDLENDCNSIGFSTGNVNYTLIQDYDSDTANVMGDLTTSPYNGFASAENYIDDSNFNGPWRSTVSGASVSNYVFADVSSGGPQSHKDWILDVFEAMITYNTLPPAPIWEMGDDQMELFRTDK